MSNVILFNDDGAMQVPAAARARARQINDDVHTTAQFPTLSIKGKVFTYIKDGLSKIITRDVDGEQEPVQSLQMVVLRANVKARVYYKEAYSEDGSAGAKPTCFSLDGVAPEDQSVEKQSAKCATCPHAVWGTGNPEKGEGTACSPNARLAVASPDKIGQPMLLRVPPGSIKSFKEAVKIGDQRQAPYNSLVMRVGFDMAAPAPKLIFKPVGLLTDAAFAEADAQFEGDVVKAIVGVPQDKQTAPALPPKKQEDPAAELDAAIAARNVVKEAKKPAAVAEPEINAALEQAEVVKKATKPAAPKEEPADVDGLLGQLDNLLGGLDD